MQAYTTEDFSPEASIGYLVRCLNQTGSAALEPLLAKDGLIYSQWCVMMLIHSGIAVTCADLARCLAHDNGAMTRLVESLSKCGWIERTRDVGDRRVVNLALTSAGHDVAMRSRAHVMERWNIWLQGWQREEFETLLRLLQKLKATLDSTDEGLSA